MSSVSSLALSTRPYPRTSLLAIRVRAGMGNFIEGCAVGQHHPLVAGWRGLSRGNFRPELLAAAVPSSTIAEG